MTTRLKAPGGKLRPIYEHASKGSLEPTWKKPGVDVHLSLAQPVQLALVAIGKKFPLGFEQGPLDDLFNICGFNLIFNLDHGEELVGRALRLNRRSFQSHVVQALEDLQHRINPGRRVRNLDSDLGPFSFVPSALLVQTRLQLPVLSLQLLLVLHQLLDSHASCLDDGVLVILGTMRQFGEQ